MNDKWTNTNKKGVRTKGVWVNILLPNNSYRRKDIANFNTQYDKDDTKAIENASYACAAVNLCRSLGITLEELENYECKAISRKLDKPIMVEMMKKYKEMGGS